MDTLRQTGLIADAIYKRHDTGAYHPESPARCDVIERALKRARLDREFEKLQPRAAAEDELLLCHTREYVATVRHEAASGRWELSTGDTPICERSFEVAQFAAGGVFCAVDAVADGRVKNAFCVVRPPGHHASAGKGRGFCVFNNVALGVRYAQKKHKLDRVLIVDWDVHHGNGTQDIFYADGSVFYCSVHQWPLYPGTGRAEETGSGAGAGRNLNLPVLPGSGGEEIIGALREQLGPAADRFEPDLVLVSAGFDSRVGDPIASLALTDDDFAELTELVLDLARRHAGGRLVSVLEGGYDLDGLASGVTAHVRALTRA